MFLQDNVKDAYYRPSRRTISGVSRQVPAYPLTLGPPAIASLLLHALARPAPLSSPSGRRCIYRLASSRRVSSRLPWSAVVSSRPVPSLRRFPASPVSPSRHACHAPALLHRLFSCRLRGLVGDALDHHPSATPLAPRVQIHYGTYTCSVHPEPSIIQHHPLKGKKHPASSIAIPTAISPTPFPRAPPTCPLPSVSPTAQSCHVSAHVLHKVIEVEAFLVLLTVPQFSQVLKPGLLGRLSQNISRLEIHHVFLPSLQVSLRLVGY